MAYRVADIAGAVSQADADNQRARLSDLQLRQGEQNLAQGSRVADLQLEGAQMDMQAKKRGEALKQIEISGKLAEQVLASGGKNYPDFVSAMQQLGVPTDKLPPQYDPATMQRFVDKSKAFLTSEYEQVQGPRGALLQKNKRTGELKQVTGPNNLSGIVGPGGKAPPGYMWNGTDDEGNPRLMAIPGGPAAQKETKLSDAKRMRLELAKNKADAVIGKVDEALGQSGFFTTGLAGSALGKIPGTGAYDLDKTIDTIKANIGFGELQAMREASPTGGALGSIAVQELTSLQSTVASLDKGQSREQLENNLKKIKQHYETWKKLVAGDEQTEETGPQAPNTAGSPRRITSDAEYNSLPSGTTFVGPDGVPRRKP